MTSRRKQSVQFAMLPWYPRDFASSTRGWPLAARAVYRELLDAQWDMGGRDVGTLPEDEVQLREIARATPAEWRIAWPLVGAKFPIVEGGRRNSRLEEHRQAALRGYEARVKGAQIANEKRRSKGREHDAERNAERSAERNAERQLSATPPSPSPSLKIPSSSNSGAEPPDPRAELWRVGVAMLTRSGHSERSARTLLGRWIRDADEATVGRLIGQAATTADPVAWISAALHRRPEPSSGDARYALALPGDPA